MKSCIIMSTRNKQILSKVTHEDDLIEGPKLEFKWEGNQREYNEVPPAPNRDNQEDLVDICTVSRPVVQYHEAKK